MATFVGKSPANTYTNILQVDGGVSGSLKDVEDAQGQASALQVSTTTVNIDGTFTVGGSAVTIASVEDITDVTLTSIATGEVLKWNGSAWINNTLAELGIAASDIGSGTFADARIAASNVTQHVASIDHDSLLNFSANEHIDWTSASSNFSTTGTVDLGSATSLEIPNGAAPTVNAAGEIAVDTTITDYTGLIKYHDGTEELTVVAMPTGNLTTTNGHVVKYNAANNEFEMAAGGAGVSALSYSITLENPGASEDASIAFTNRAITISEIRAVLVGSSTPSVTWTVRHGTDRSAAGAEVVTSGTTTTSTTTGSDVTVFNDATVVADSFLWLETTAQSGTVNELHVTIVYSED